MQISDRLMNIQPSLTLAMNAKALELKEQGVMVTSLAVGEPDFPTPKHICEAAKQAIDSNFCRYTAVPGIMELRKAVCGRSCCRWPAWRPRRCAWAWGSRVRRRPGS